MEWLRDIQEGFREPAMALLTQFWWVIPLGLLAFWLYFVLEVEPARVAQSTDEVLDSALNGDSDGGDGGRD